MATMGRLTHGSEMTGAPVIRAGERPFLGRSLLMQNVYKAIGRVAAKPGDQTRAAGWMGVSRPTMRERLTRFRLRWAPARRREAVRRSRTDRRPSRHHAFWTAATVRGACLPSRGPTAEPAGLGALVGNVPARLGHQAQANDQVGDPAPTPDGSRM